MDLSNKVAVVTGAASGIGRATAQLLACRGARVCVADINGDAVRKVTAAINDGGGNALPFVLDVCSEQANADLVAAILAAYGRLDIAHLNAGILSQKSILECDLSSWSKVLEVNLTGVFLGLKHCVPPMIEARAGSVIVTASFAGREGARGMPAYVASKHGVVGLTKAAAAEFGDHGVRVNAICPGAIYTEMLITAGTLDEVNQSPLAQTMMLKRIGEAREVAELVAFLASDSASFITGGIYAVDGGMPMVG